MAVLRATDVQALRPLGFSKELALASIEWLHDLLRNLSATGFVAPVPLEQLDGRSIVLVDDVVWELLSFVPGRPMGWSDEELESAGGLLARLHRAIARLPVRSQRPGALPIGECKPSDPAARRIRSVVERELSDLGYESARRSVVHGDATQANVVIDGDAYALVDYTIAYQEQPLFDVASALWRNGRIDANAVAYDGRRVGRFVRGYHRERPLKPGDERAIVTYLKCRGLQLQQRLELRRGVDETVMARLQSVCAQEHQLIDALAIAVSA